MAAWYLPWGWVIIFTRRFRLTYFTVGSSNRFASLIPLIRMMAEIKNPKKKGKVIACETVGLLMLIILYRPASIPIKKIAKSMMPNDLVLNVNDPMIREKGGRLFSII